MRKKPKKIEAEAMLELLIQAYPQGVPTRELAERLFGKDTSKARTGIYRMARSLRDVGYPVYSLGGIYYFCAGDAEKMLSVAKLRGAHTVGNAKGLVQAVQQAVDALEEHPDTEKIAALEELRGGLRMALSRISGEL